MVFLISMIFSLFLLPMSGQYLLATSFGHESESDQLPSLILAGFPPNGSSGHSSPLSSLNWPFGQSHSIHGVIWWVEGISSIRGFRLIGVVEHFCGFVVACKSCLSYFLIYTQVIHLYCRGINVSFLSSLPFVGLGWSLWSLPFPTLVLRSYDGPGLWWSHIMYESFSVFMLYCLKTSLVLVSMLHISLLS
jgi:hypothetical protein